MVHLTVECAVVLRSGKYRGEIGTSLLAELPVRRRGVGKILPTTKVYIHAHRSSTNCLSCTVCRWSRFVAVVVSGMNHYWSAHKAIVLYASISSGQSMKHYSFASTLGQDATSFFRKGGKCMWSKCRTLAIESSVIYCTHHTLF